MTRPLQLDEFGQTDVAVEAVRATDAPSAAAPALTDEDRLAAYESGYQSGWDDSAAAAAEAGQRVGTDLAHNLQDYRFTYEDARRDVLQSLGPLFEDIIAQFLPGLAGNAIAPVVLAELQGIAEQTTETSVVLVAAPGTLPVLQHLAKRFEQLEVELRAEPAFADGQVSIRFGAQRRDVDLSEAVARMGAAIQSFIDEASTNSSDNFQGAA